MEKGENWKKNLLTFMIALTHWLSSLKGIQVIYTYVSCIYSLHWKKKSQVL